MVEKESVELLQDNEFDFHARGHCGRVMLCFDS